MGSAENHLRIAGSIDLSGEIGLSGDDRSWEDEIGLVAVGGELTAETVLSVYLRGVFPWPLSFSYGRALQAPSLAAWGQNPESNVGLAQEKLAHRARMNGLATLGQYDASMESE